MAPLSKYSSQCDIEGRMANVVIYTCHGAAPILSTLGIRGKTLCSIRNKRGYTVGESEMYSDKSGMENGIASVAKNAPMADVVDNT